MGHLLRTLLPKRLVLVPAALAVLCCIVQLFVITLVTKLHAGTLAHPRVPAPAPAPALALASASSSAPPGPGEVIVQQLAADGTNSTSASMVSVPGLVRGSLVLVDDAKWSLSAGDLASVELCPTALLQPPRPRPRPAPVPRTATAAALRPFVLVHLNMWNGAHEPVRRARLSEWVKAVRPSVLSLNEAQGWSEDELRRAGESWGLPFTALLPSDPVDTNDEAAGHTHQQTAYKIALLSATPMRVLGRYTEGFRHGALHVAVALPAGAGATPRRQASTLHIVTTHLTPGGGVANADEAALLMGLIQSHAENAPTLILGDLNALSRADKDHYERDAAVVQRFSASEKLRRKFMRSGEELELELDFATMDAFAAGGFTDLGGLVVARNGMQHNSTRAGGLGTSGIDGGIDGGRWETVPTRLVNDDMHAVPMRLDYALANPAALALVTPGTRAAAHTPLQDSSQMGVQRPRVPSARMARPAEGTAAALLSDHFPLWLAICPQTTSTLALCHRMVARTAPLLMNEQSTPATAASTRLHDHEPERPVASAPAPVSVAEQALFCTWRKDLATFWTAALRTREAILLRWADEWAEDQQQVPFVPLNDGGGGDMHAGDGTDASAVCSTCKPGGVEDGGMPLVVSAIGSRVCVEFCSTGGYCGTGTVYQLGVNCAALATNATSTPTSSTTTTTPPPNASQWSVVAATRGESCEDACARRGLGSCAQGAFARLNNCDRLRANLECWAGCSRSDEVSLEGAEQPAYAVGGEFVGRCLLASPAPSSNGDAPTFSCTAAHIDTRRICPCLRVQPGGSLSGKGYPA